MTAPSTGGREVIGEPDQPVRVFSFAGGGFDTVRQLGVAHALLVIQGRAPDAVVGISAGAVNAAALAEILQAGEELQQHHDWASWSPKQKLIERQRRQVARLREVLAAYQRAPGDILGEAKPDAFQIEAQRPLQPLLLPINEERERAERSRLIASRAGLINLYNMLLDVQLPIGTLTRGIRRILGLKAAAEVRSRTGRWLARILEFVRLWLLLGGNLYTSAPLLWPLLRPLLPMARPGAVKPREVGATAATLIFHPLWMTILDRRLRHWLSFAAVFLVWLSVTYLVFGLPYVLARIIAQLTGANLASLSLGLYGVALLGLAGIFADAWGELLAFNRSTTRRLMTEIGSEAFGLAGLLGYWVVWFMLLASVIYGSFIFGQVLAEGRIDLGEVLQNVTLQWRQLGWFFRTYGWALPVVFAGAAYLIYSRLSRARDYLRDLLAQFDLADGLLNEHPLRMMLVDLFDPGYYGTRDMGQVLERTLRDELDASRQRGEPRRIRDYSDPARDTPLHVGLAVADVEDGKLQTLRDDIPIVDGLIAATSVVPLFRPYTLNGHVYIDGMNVSNEPTRPLLQYLRERVNVRSTVVHLYSVATLPFTRASLEGAAPDPDNLLDVVWRAGQLQRFRDATLERRLTELYTQAIPSGRAVFPERQHQDDGPLERYLRVWVSPVEPDQPLEINRRLLEACKERRRELIAETVADGCRTALEVMLAAGIDAEGDAGIADPDEEPYERGAPVQELGAADGYEKRVSLPVVQGQPVVRCRLAVKRFLEKSAFAAGCELPVRLPGSDRSRGPGVIDICSHCALGRSVNDAATAKPPRVRSLRQRSTPAAVREGKAGPLWPHRLVQEKAATNDPHFARPRSTEQVGAFPVDPAQRPAWPVERPAPAPAPTRRPLVSLLFSGGVFRGVYQMGVLNALNEASVKPDVVAGASIGSITAAMVARTLSDPDPGGRHYLIARLSAAYLAVDRLVLTDRFADFVREVTLRAAATRFSLREADRLMRRYDSASLTRFARDARLVVAGLERLVYVSPFELRDLVEAFRRGRSGEVVRQLREYSQEWLDRMKVGTQILGAEPLALLIEEFVLDVAARSYGSAGGVPFDYFLYSGAGLCFLATTTNLTQGRLEILGDQQLGLSRRNANMLSGLLSSSAFPGVFRPRGSWELMPEENAQDDYIDGGVMDNLPLDAVAQFLHGAARSGIVANRPVFGEDEVPHLLFSASLEPNVQPLGDAVNRVADNWPAVQRRAKQLRYNQKLDLYAQAQEDLRTIWSYRRAATNPPRPWSELTPEQREHDWEPMNLHVATVRPEWLCGTFAFHPMLGFRRVRQAMSIAHGCATTLIALGRLAQSQPNWVKAWGLNANQLPKDVPGAEQPIVPKDRGQGNCWFRDKVPCPFSSKSLDAIAERPGSQPLGPQTRTELARIYARCGDPETHAARR